MCKLILVRKRRQEVARLARSAAPARGGASGAKQLALGAPLAVRNLHLSLN